MAQNRKPPAFQEYAATILSSKAFRVMNLSQRGLLFTMRLECWVNHSVPSLSNELAKYLGLGHQEVSEALSSDVMSYFNSSGGSLICPELEDYRKHLTEIKEKQIAGGKKGAAKTNGKWKEIESGNPQVTCESLVKFNSAQLSSKQSLVNGNIDDEFVTDYERASNGS
jgi:hypothetical protein